MSVSVGKNRWIVTKRFTKTVYQSVIARFESNKTTPQLNTLLKVVDALNCDLKIVPKSWDYLLIR